jgi:hypothetical protein
MSTKVKKIIGLLVIGLLISGVLYAGYLFLTREPAIRSPLPKEEGVKVIFITPEVTPSQ